MASQRPSPQTDPKLLLAEAARQPFTGPPATAVEDWFRVLAEHFPLWAFQRWAFANLHAMPVPVTYPLGQFVRSILIDENFDLEEVQRRLFARMMGMGKDREATRADEADNRIGPLDAELDRRRMGMAEGTFSVSTFVEGAHGQRRLAPGYRSFLPESVCDLGDWWPPDPEVPYDTGGSFDGYEYIGRELLRHVEALRFAIDKNQRLRAQSSLDRFLKDLGAKLSHHRPTEGPHKDLIEELFQQGRKLLEVCWNPPGEVSKETGEILRREGVKGSDVGLWALRLALPVLSRREIVALGHECAKAAQHQRAGAYPTPRRFTIWLLAHRLGLSAMGLARRVLNTDDAKYFHSRNPIDAA